MMDYFFPGKVVSGYRIRNGKWSLIGRQSPQLPQVSYPIRVLIITHNCNVLVSYLFVFFVQLFTLFYILDIPTFQPKSASLSLAVYMLVLKLHRISVEKMHLFSNLNKHLQQYLEFTKYLRVLGGLCNMRSTQNTNWIMKPKGERLIKHKVWSSLVGMSCILQKCLSVCAQDCSKLEKKPCVYTNGFS